MASIACLVLIDTDDPRILDFDPSTAEKAAEIRAAVVENLPRLTRVIAIMPEFESRAMMMAHDFALENSGLGRVLRPPKGYVAPADQKP